MKIQLNTLDKPVTPVDRWVVNPLKRFMHNNVMGGVVLFASAFLAVFLANSPWSHEFHQLWELKFSLGFNGYTIDKSLHHWINDGLMAVFFFVVGLELKREVVAGELSNPKNAILPIAAAVGGMVFPALIYFSLNPSGPATNGWGIPMATDIAFALGVLYLLGDKVPFALKLFLTVLAIVDDIGAVLIIAFFYTSDIHFLSLAIGAAFMALLIVSNLLGVRNTVYYGVIGIGGLWLAFLLSGVHATIAAVLAAMTIPAKVKMSEHEYINHVNHLMERFEAEEPNDTPIVTATQLHIIEEIRDVSQQSLTPLQQLEHHMHPLVVFVIMPIFALSNAGVTLSGDMMAKVVSPVFWGIALGLFLGKLLGVFGVSLILTKLKWAPLPEGMNTLHLLGAGFLASIGFTMSLFIGGLAFAENTYIEQAKLAILATSLVGSIVGYLLLRYAHRHGHRPLT